MLIVISVVTDSEADTEIADFSESLPNRYSPLSLAHVCACVTGFQHSVVASCTDLEDLPIFPEYDRHQDLGFFAAVSNGFGSSIREMIFTYQVAVCKRHCLM